MFRGSKFRQSGFALALATLLLFSGILPGAPNAAPAVYAQGLGVILWVM